MFDIVSFPVTLKKLVGLLTKIVGGEGSRDGS
jgi:hypothetical protein